MRQDAKRVQCARAACTQWRDTPKSAGLRYLGCLLVSHGPLAHTSSSTETLSNTHTTELIMAHPRRRHMRPEDEAIRPVEAQIESDRPRHGRDGRLAARHDVRVATH